MLLNVSVCLQHILSLSLSLSLSVCTESSALIWNVIKLTGTTCASKTFQPIRVEYSDRLGIKKKKKSDQIVKSDTETLRNHYKAQIQHRGVQ